MVSFAHSSWLLALPVPVVLAVGVFFRHRWRLARQRSLASPSVWNRLMGGAPSTGLARLLLWVLAAVSIILALARPQWGDRESQVSIRTRDLVFALDLSRSMQCPDVIPDRLHRALAIIRHSLPGLDGNRVGIVIFAGEAYPLVPLTTDLEAVASFLDGVEPEMVNTPGSNIEAAAAAAVKLLPEEGEGRVLVLFSDGENLQGDPDAAGRMLRDSGVGFIGIVVGTEEGGPIPMIDAGGAVHYKKDRQGRTVVTRADPTTLEDLADALNGAVVRADSGETEKELIADVEALRTREMEKKHRPEKIERFPVFLGLAVFFLSLSFLLSPWRKTAIAGVVLLVCFSSVSAAQGVSAPGAAPAAGSPAPMCGAPPPEEPPPPPPPKPSWWQRWIPGGSRRLARSGVRHWEKGEAEKAAEDFGAALVLDPENRQLLYDYGTALAESGYPGAASEILEKAGDVVGAEYNAGTAALKGKKAQAAVEHLRNALLADPADPDVKRNYELALRLLQQQQQQDQKKKDQDQKDKDKKDQDEKDTKKQEEEKKKKEEEKKKQQEEQQKRGVSPTPTPAPAAGAQPAPTPTPDPRAGLYSAIQQSENHARKAMRTPTPAQSRTVEKDW